MNFSYIILLVLLISFTNSKVSNCRNKFDKDDWVYCTKFGTKGEESINVEVKAKHTAIFKN